ncbi:uncharacterized protein B0I36DRAFT_374925 [Microdochium trichocladiopsis]|uniref:methylated diphthine methylhydrolase n=1 Tax=Microdochium trichocladiopsis TaxID=1682393 RepID=A0A9P8Y7C4_9PEZI|nr:uncharacterized protein B0I36DRAFT_374925 [Microdochium trichocladiopsis]KAH7029392.1 hypothetical protein B0I36DRAFT_374925 [Microdochium trichocladiopsis]
MAGEPEPTTSLKSLILDLPPSCIEFCPAHPSYFVVGTYNLEKDEAHSEPPAEGEDDVKGAQEVKRKQNRKGSLVVFRLGKSEVAQVQTFQYPSAILDLHFHPSQLDVCAVVSSTGALSFFRLTDSGLLEEIVSHSSLGSSEGVLFLSCAWHPVIHNLLAITTSDFQVHIFHIDSDWTAHATNDEPVALHQLEAWTSAFSPFVSGLRDGEQLQELILFSGGDDSRLLASAVAYSSPTPHADTTSVIQGLSPPRGFKGHQAGVTAILPLPLHFADESSIIVTGSYDDHIRVFRFSGHLQPPVLLAEKNLGGGVWRLKAISASVVDEEGWQAVLLASCMHAGTCVVQVCGDRSGNSQVKVLGRFKEHKSMNYGSDFSPPSAKLGKPLQVISTSFYDRLLCLWEFKI